MSSIVAEVMAFLNNHFPLMAAPGEWRVTGSALEGPVPLQAGCWIAIRDAGLWDGVFASNENARFPDLPDGTFTGTVHLLNPPKEFLALCEEIAQWARENPRGSQRSYGSDSRGENPGWEAAFAPRLRPWRRMLRDI